VPACHALHSFFNVNRIKNRSPQPVRKDGGTVGIADPIGFLAWDFPASIVHSPYYSMWAIKKKGASEKYFKQKLGHFEKNT
jgi:hypothetical protein